MQRSSTIARNSIFYGIDLAVGFLSGIVASVLIARAMGPAKLGEFNYITWLVYTGGLLGTFGFPTAVRKFASEHMGAGRRDKALVLIRFTFWVQTGLGLAVLLGLLAVTRLQLTPEQFAYAALAAFSVIPAASLGVLSGGISALEDLLPNAVASIAASVASFVTILLTLWLGWDLPGLAASLLISRILDYVVRYIGFRSRFGKVLWAGRASFRLEGFTREEKRGYLRFCGEATVLLLVQVILWGRPEVWFLNHWWPPAEVSFYQIGFNFTDKIQLIPQMLGAAISTTMLVEYGRQPRSAGILAANSAHYLALVSLPILAGLAAVSHHLVLAFYKPAFAPAVLPLIIQCVLLSARALVTPGSEMLVAADRQRTLVIIGLSMSAVKLALDALFIYKGGAVGAAWANGLPQLAATVLTWAAALEFYQVGFPYRRLARVGAASALMGILVWLLIRPLGPWPGITAGLPAGVLLFALFLKLFRCLDAEDRRRLQSLDRGMPAFLRPAYTSFLLKLSH
jgi:O-antigen/teichoic acid export membrane protein